MIGGVFSDSIHDGNIGIHAKARQLMTRHSLRSLYDNHIGKASDKWEIYLEEYGRTFEEFRDSPIRLLEIGIQNGGSLEIWSKYFSKATTLVGCDINSDCAQLSYTDPRACVIVGDANTPDTYAMITQKSAEFDIVIDDGSHLSRDIIKSFCLYFPHVADGGTYIAEDLHCSYWAPFEGGLFHPYSSISFFKLLADVINFEHWGVEAPDRVSLLSGILSHNECDIALESLAQIRSVEFINSMCIIRKHPSATNVLGRRIVAGQEELVVTGLLSLNGARFTERDAPSQADNPWSTRLVPPAESIMATELSLTAAQHSLAEAELSRATTEHSLAAAERSLQACNDMLAERDAAARQNSDEIERLTQLTQHLQEALLQEKNRATMAERENSALIQSRSWRLTAPLRRIGAIARNLFK